VLTQINKNNLKNDINMSTNSCNINDKGSSCCSSQPQTETVNYEEHWDNAYLNSPQEKLGWYETDLSPTLGLISKTKIDKSATILNVGSGSTTLVDELLNEGYSKIIATDLSKVALKNLEKRVGCEKVEYIVDDLTHPKNLKIIAPVDLWIDRAVLHFFTEENEQNAYFDLLKDKVNSKGFVLLAEYNLTGASRCAGLPVNRYSKGMLVKKLGKNFDLVESFDHTYFMPSGDERPYIYTLFKKQ